MPEIHVEIQMQNERGCGSCCEHHRLFRVLKFVPRFLSLLFRLQLYLVMLWMQ
jgi:hypothetical protein